MQFNTVIFDLDGTLIDSMGVWQQVDHEFLSKRGIAVPDDLFKDVEGGNSIVEIAHYFKRKFGITDAPEAIIEEWVTMVRTHYMNDVMLKPGAAEFVKLLHDSGIKMGVGTSNTRELAEIVLQANGVLPYFSSIVAGCSDIKGKPFPDIFLRVASSLMQTHSSAWCWKMCWWGCRRLTQLGCRCGRCKRSVRPGKQMPSAQKQIFMPHLTARLCRNGVSYE